MDRKRPLKWFGLLLNGLIAGLTMSYPFLIWFSLDYFQPRTLALVLAGLFLLRFLASGMQANAGLMRFIVPICVLFLLAIAWLNQAGGLMVYPVFVSLLFFTVFSISLAYPPTWSVFFLSNAAVSLFTVWYGDRWLWSLYNGCVFYVLMGLLMAAEMAVRRKVKASY